MKPWSPKASTVWINLSPMHQERCGLCSILGTIGKTNTVLGVQIRNSGLESRSTCLTHETLHYLALIFTPSLIFVALPPKLPVDVKLLKVSTHWLLAFSTPRTSTFNSFYLKRTSAFANRMISFQASVKILVFWNTLTTPNRVSCVLWVTTVPWSHLHDIAIISLYSFPL